MRYRRFNLTLLPLLMLFTAAASAEESNEAVPKVYIERLWSKPVTGALARQETQSFVLEPGFDHHVCVAVGNARDVKVNGLVLEGLDTRGEVVSRQIHPDFDGTKRCYPAMLPTDGEPGSWAYRVSLDGGSTIAAIQSVEVARTLETAPFYQPSSVPYVLGRPNYDDSIAPGDYVGRLVWVMQVDAQGKVSNVEIEVSEGVGERLKPRALAAGYLSLYPPDPSRGEEGVSLRRTLNFARD